MTQGLALTDLAAARKILDDALRDKTYQSATPLGLVVRRYLRHKRTEQGCTEATLLNYEIPLAYLCIDHPTLDLAAFDGRPGTELLRDFWDKHWGARAAGTRRKNMAILSDFFKWAVKEDLMVGDPTIPISRPKKRGAERGTISEDDQKRIIDCAHRGRDKSACALAIALGLRKSELSRIQLKHYDAQRRLLRVFGKGGKIREIPVVDPWLVAIIDLHWSERAERDGASRDEYLLYPEHYGKRHVGPDGADLTRPAAKPKKIPPRHSGSCPKCAKDTGLVETTGWCAECSGYGKRKHRESLGEVRVGLIWEDRSKPLSASAMHRWWKTRLADAGVSDYKLHEARHTAITDFLRASGNLKLAQILAGHASVQTTADIYGHLDVNDLAEALTIVAARKAARGEE